jgi:hypothetical protein
MKPGGSQGRAGTTTMAKILDFGDDQILFTVTMGVGPGRANNRDDVTLVQYYLNLWISHESVAAERRQFGERARQLLATDGIIGPKTKARIKMFETWMNDMQPWPRGDGCIDRMPNDRPGFRRADGSIGTCMIFYINQYVVEFYEPVYGNLLNLTRRPDYPPRLRSLVNRYSARAA